MDKTKRFFNAHAHCFTYDHVPKYFLSKKFAVRWLLSIGWIHKMIKDSPITGKLGFWGSIVKFLVKLFLGFDKAMLIRFINFVRYGDVKDQAEVIKCAQSYYPRNTGFVFLTMDMEYMGAGIPEERYETQLKKLALIKAKPEYSEVVYPFVFVDPRRIQPVHSREVGIEDSFVGALFFAEVKRLLSNSLYQGIKLYPALGYFPFDRRMRQVYDYALKHEIPFITHCTIGSVHFKYKLEEKEMYHPMLKIQLPDLKPMEFQKFFTHPLNYECLLNRDLLKMYWGEDAPNYESLKICIAHWGTEEEWHNFMDNAWLETDYKPNPDDSRNASLYLENWHIQNEEKNFSWFTIVCDLIRRYPNVYVDISYTLQDATLLPLLKVILETDSKIRTRVLFGTDFYMVSKAISERKFAINVRSFLGDELFMQIAQTNTRNFLSNSFGKVM